MPDLKDSVNKQKSFDLIAQSVGLRLPPEILIKIFDRALAQQLYLPTTDSSTTSDPIVCGREYLNTALRLIRVNRILSHHVHNIVHTHWEALIALNADRDYQLRQSLKLCPFTDIFGVDCRDCESLKHTADSTSRMTDWLRWTAGRMENTGLFLDYSRATWPKGRTGSVVLVPRSKPGPY